VPRDMADVVIVPLKTGNDHTDMLSVCIYETLHRFEPCIDEYRSPPTHPCNTTQDNAPTDGK
jgi:hypothetical protein